MASVWNDNDNECCLPLIEESQVLELVDSIKFIPGDDTSKISVGHAQMMNFQLQRMHQFNVAKQTELECKRLDSERAVREMQLHLDGKRLEAEREAKQLDNSSERYRLEREADLRSLEVQAQQQRENRPGGGGW